MSRTHDFLVVGAGLFGATFARVATDAGRRCLVVDSRPHTGGNLRCERIAGIDVHCHGPHIFHTSDPEVWRFVTAVVPFNSFVNRPLAVAPDGRVYNLPFNMNTFRQLWQAATPAEALARLERQRAEAPGGVPRNLEEQALQTVGRDIYELLVKGYTEKQWGRPCSQLPPDIIRRLPLRLVYDNNYFDDRFQGIPLEGYNGLVDGLLSGSDVELGCDYLSRRRELDGRAPTVVYTGPLDAFYGYRFGRLAWRSLRFETRVLDIPNHQGNAVVNYTSADVPYTRVVEHKHFQASGAAVYDNPRTVVTREYPVEWQPGMVPCYPVNDRANSALYARYRALADREPRTLFGGRLADYRYYDMAPVVRRAIDAATACLARP